MTPLEQQFEILRNDRIGTSLQKLPDGSRLVIVPDVALPAGWSKPTVSVRFVHQLDIRLPARIVFGRIAICDYPMATYPRTRGRIRYRILALDICGFPGMCRRGTQISIVL